MSLRRKALFIEQVRIDGETQVRVRLDPDVVKEYAEGYRAKPKDMPPISVVYDGTAYWLWDGFHRFHAARTAQMKSIDTLCEEGTVGDAQWQACSANQTHGLRRTNEDKRKAVALAIRLHPEDSSRSIALHCGVHHDMIDVHRKQIQLADSASSNAKSLANSHVSTSGMPVRSSSAPSNPPMPRRTGLDGKSYPAARANTLADALGRTIRVDLLPVLSDIWNRRKEPGQLAKQVSDLRCALKDIKDDPLYSRCRELQAFDMQLDRMYGSVKACIPHTICAACQGQGCKACGNTGFMSEFEWKTGVPEDQKVLILKG